MKHPLRFLLLVSGFVASSLFSFSASAGSSVAMECPCSLNRSNATLVEIDFNLVFTQNQAQSGNLEIYLYGHEKRSAALGWYYVLASSTISSVAFSNTAVPFSLSLPFYYTGFTSGYLSLVLKDGSTGEVLDIVPLTVQPITVSADAGVAINTGSDEVFLGQAPSFQVDEYAFGFSAPDFTNSTNPLGSETLLFELSASNLSSYYSLYEKSFTLNYDAQGRADINLQGTASIQLDKLLDFAPEHKYLQASIYRNGQLIMFYTVATMDNSLLPDYALSLQEIDTLSDSDGDGITNYVEQLTGSPVDIPASSGLAEIEAAFLFGDAALEYYGTVAEIQGYLSHIIALANDAYADSGLNIQLQQSELVYIGDDRNLLNTDLLNRLQQRTAPFSNVDALLSRQPDIIVHLNTISWNDDNGGMAWINGQWSDGVIDYQSMASGGTNTAVVDMDNTALTLVHEVGHLLGLDHSRRQVQGSHYSSFHWALGHGVDQDFVTIMGYDSYFGYPPQVALFSSPELSCSASEESCGVNRQDSINGADAVSALRSSAHQWSAVANGFAPTLTLNGENPLYLDGTNLIAIPPVNLGASAFDAEDGDLSAGITFSQAVDSDDPAVDYLQVYSVVDSDNNSTTVTRRVAIVVDTDGDGVFNRFDNDDDNDGVEDVSDQFPYDSRYSMDSDGDGMADAWEILYGLDPNNPLDASSDQDIDGTTAAEEFIAGSVPVGTLDIDGDGQFDGLADGMLILRHLFGFSDDQLIDGSIAADALYTSASQIEQRIDALGDRVDIDGDNQLDALTDGLLILRYLLGYEGAALVEGAVSEQGTRRQPADIETYLQSLKLED